MKDNIGALTRISNSAFYGKVSDCVGHKKLNDIGPEARKKTNNEILEAHRKTIFGVEGDEGQVL